MSARNKEKLTKQQRAIGDWLDDNWETIKCAASAAGGLAFSAAVQLRSDPQSRMSSWWLLNNAIENVTNLVGCFVSEPEVQQYFPEVDKKCLCSEHPGQLIFDAWDRDGNVIKRNKYGLDEGTKRVIRQWVDEDSEEYVVTVETRNNETTQYSDAVYNKPGHTALWYIQPPPGSACCGQELPDPPDFPDPPLPPIPPIEECTWTAKVIDSYVDNNTMLWNKIYMTPSDPSCGDEFCYWEDARGPIYDVGCTMAPPNPFQDTGSGGCNKTIAGTTYEQAVPCTFDWEKLEYGTILKTEIESAPFMDATIARLDEIASMVDKVLRIQDVFCKQPLRLAPHWRSIRFEEKGMRPGSKRRIDKLLRYRGKEPGQLDALAEHWAEFEWDTGPVCVFHKGSPVGTPQVWADSEEEGKRVLRHAFREAGFDADQVGQWGVSGSANPRYGVRTRVELKVVDGCWSITSRPGPDGWPEAPVAFPYR